MCSQSMPGTSQMDDRIVASDLLISAKTEVKTYASALVEAATQEVRTVLKRQLNEAISFQEQVSNYMIQKGWYNAYNTSEQIKMDMSQTQSTINQLNRQTAGSASEQ